MSTTTLTYRRQPSLLPWIILAIGIILLSLPAAKENAHASLHAEADQIRACYASGNLNQIWSNSSGERLNCIVNLPDGRVGDRVIQFCKSAGWIEITAYVLGDGSLAEAIRTLKAKACQRVY